MSSTDRLNGAYSPHCGPNNCQPQSSPTPNPNADRPFQSSLFSPSQRSTTTLTTHPRNTEVNSRLDEPQRQARQVMAATSGAATTPQDARNALAVNANQTTAQKLDIMKTNSDKKGVFYYFSIPFRAFVALVNFIISFFSASTPLETIAPPSLTSSESPQTTLESEIRQIQQARALNNRASNINQVYVEPNEHIIEHKPWFKNIFSRIF